MVTIEVGLDFDVSTDWNLSRFVCYGRQRTGRSCSMPGRSCVNVHAMHACLCNNSDQGAVFLNTKGLTCGRICRSDRVKRLLFGTSARSFGYGYQSWQALSQCTPVYAAPALCATLAPASLRPRSSQRRAPCRRAPRLRIPEKLDQRPIASSASGGECRCWRDWGNRMASEGSHDSHFCGLKRRKS